MTTTFSPNWAAIVRQAIAAGFAGAIVIDAYLWLATIVPAHGSLLAMWQWVASAAIGPVAFSSGTFAWFGLLVHVIVSIGWAGGYAYFAQTQKFVSARWFVSGFVYGIIVYCFMLLLLLGAHAFVVPSGPLAILNAVLAHTLFFGVPVAYVVARMSRA
ncbi:MAG TPA: hypothetical protein VMA98_12825 [Candidatus Acidoferrales bacterium]|nr:hypothetical protein [Candidatus Acidoferrales bacterium]